MLTDLENQASIEGDAIHRSESYRPKRPSSRRRASLKPVPLHLRKPKDRRHIKQRMNTPHVPKPNLSDWLSDFLDRNS